MPDTNRVFISLGSNIDPHKHVGAAIIELSELLTDAVVSPIYHSPAVGMDGNDFLNAVVGGDTSESLNILVDLLHQIEGNAGRVRQANKFVDRTLDLDLLLFGELVRTDADDQIETTLPHPEILDQAYVLQPITDIAGDLVHPLKKQTLSELLQDLKSNAPEKFTHLQQVTLHDP